MMTSTSLRQSHLAAAILLALTARGATAIEIDYTLTALGGSDYRYDYTLTNDGTLGSGVAVESFDIEFPTSLITGWTEIGSGPGDWDEFNFPTLGDDLFGADALTGGIADGDSTSFSCRSTGAALAHRGLSCSPSTTRLPSTCSKAA